MAVDLSQLPPADVVEPLDFDSLLAERRARLLELSPEDKRAELAETLALESEPLVKLLEENTYRELVLRQRINDAARAVMIAHATKADLDQLAANFNVARLTVSLGDPNATPPVSAQLERDEDLRARVQRAFEGLSVAGPSGAYEYHALSADGRIADARAFSPAPCEVVVSILSRESDGSASKALLDTVRETLSDEEVRPIGDRLTVQSAHIVSYAITATLYLYPGPEQEPILAAAQARAERYVATQRRIGRDIRRSAIYAALHADGVQRVELISPASDVVLNDTQASHCTVIALTNGGTDE